MLLKGYWYYDGLYASGSGGCIRVGCGRKTWKDEGFMPVGWGEVKGWIFTMFKESEANGDSGWCDEGPAKFDVSGSFSVCIAGRLLVRLNMPLKRESSRKTGLASKWDFIHAKMSFFFWPSVASPKTCAMSWRSAFVFEVSAPLNGAFGSFCRRCSSLSASFATRCSLASRFFCSSTIRNVAADRNFFRRHAPYKPAPWKTFTIEPSVTRR